MYISGGNERTGYKQTKKSLAWNGSVMRCDAMRCDAIGVKSCMAERRSRMFKKRSRIFTFLPYILFRISLISSLFFLISWFYLSPLEEDVLTKKKTNNNNPNNDGRKKEEEKRLKNSFLLFFPFFFLLLQTSTKQGLSTHPNPAATPPSSL
jgi:hypothetical protein